LTQTPKTLFPRAIQDFSAGLLKKNRWQAVFGKKMLGKTTRSAFKSLPREQS
jgi:hypothetical protein